MYLRADQIFGLARHNILDGVTLVNAGTAIWTGGVNGGNIIAGNGSVINNTGVFDIQSNRSLLFNGVGATPTFNNTSVLKKTAGTGGTDLQGTLNNSGTVDVQAGGLGIEAFFQNAGRTLLNGGTITASGALQIQWGTIEGSGTIFANLLNGGQVSPGFSPGLIDLKGSYVQTSTGGFKAEIGGYTAWTQYDRLNVTGSVMLGGSLSLSVINGFAPVDGDLFTIIDNDSVDAVIDTFNGLPEGAIFSIPGGNQFKISYNGFGTGNDVVVKAINRPPTVGDPTVPDPVAVNTMINLSANFTDPDIQDTHTAVWDWDDGSTSSGTVSEANGSGSVTGSHVYSAAGVYSVKLTVTDNHNLAGISSSSYVVIYDPSAGFVTGNGWINSPSGAYTANLALTGKANFGFESKYKNGNSVPTGNTEFQFKVANFNFKSTAYEWLVVSGAKARYRGTGTVNGTGSYGFELTAWDGQVNGGGGVDKFRIKIWNNNQGNGVVYDNMMNAADGADPTTALGGGSIVIHKNGNNLVLNSAARGTPSAAPRLTDSQLSTAFTDAIAEWAAHGLSSTELQELQELTVRIADLPGNALGLASESTNYVWVDADAAGYGWSFSTVDLRSGGVDLLSVLTHELGHKLGYDHDVMGESLNVGERHLAMQTNRVIPYYAELGKLVTNGLATLSQQKFNRDADSKLDLGQVRSSSTELNDKVDQTFADWSDDNSWAVGSNGYSILDEPQSLRERKTLLYANDKLNEDLLDELAIAVSL